MSSRIKSAVRDTTADFRPVGIGSADMRELNLPKPPAAGLLDAVSRLIAYDPLTGLLTWKVDRRGRAKAGSVLSSKNGDGYIRTNLSGFGVVRGHHIAWALAHGVWPSGQIDHINGIRDDNRLCNLRVLERSRHNQQNFRRKRKDSRQKFMGIQQTSERCFVASIKADGRRFYLGSFDTPEGAHAAYIDAKRRLHKTCTL